MNSQLTGLIGGLLLWRLAGGALLAAAPPAATEVLVRAVRPPADDEAPQRPRVLSYGLTYDDRERLAALPDVARVIPVRTFPQEVRRLERMHPGRVIATTADDDKLLRNVAVLGATTATRLFPMDDPVGKTVRVGPHFYMVVGVLRESARPMAGLKTEELDGGIFLPLQTCSRRFGERIAIRQGDAVRFEAVPLHAVLVRVASPDKRAAVIDAVRTLLRARHDQKDWDVQAVNDP